MSLSLAPHHKGGEGRHVITYRCPERLIKKSGFGGFSFQVFPIRQTLLFQQIILSRPLKTQAKIYLSIIPKLLIQKKNDSTHISSFISLNVTLQHSPARDKYAGSWNWKTPGPWANGTQRTKAAQINTITIGHWIFYACKITSLYTYSINR